MESVKKKGKKTPYKKKNKEFSRMNKNGKTKKKFHNRTIKTTQQHHRTKNFNTHHNCKNGYNQYNNTINVTNLQQIYGFLQIIFQLPFDFLQNIEQSKKKEFFMKSLHVFIWA